MNTKRNLWLLLGLLVAGMAVGASGIAAQEKANDEDAEVVAANEEITVRVVNDNWSDMRIYAVRNGQRHRLGTVTSFTAERFVLPDFLQPDIVEVQLLAVPIGGSRSVLSPGIYLSPGEELIWGLQNNLALSGTLVG